MNKSNYIVDTEDFYQNAPCGFLTCDADGIIVGINDTLLKWTGRERSETEGLVTFNALLTIGSRIFMETHIKPLLKLQGYVNEVSMEFLGKRQSVIPVLVNAYTATNHAEAGEYHRFTIVDYSSRKSFENELIEARKKAERSELMLRQVNEDLERFAYIASHDLQAPLNTISGLIELIRMKKLLVEDAKAEKIFELIVRNAERMRKMISDLLEYRTLDRIEQVGAPVALPLVCLEAMENLSADIMTAGAEVRLADGLPKVVGVESQLVRLFQNLFSNSIKFRSAIPPVITVNAEVLGGIVRISVADNGRGFDPSKAEIIFGFMERLQSRDEIEGTGVGLTACRRIAEMHGGRIWAESVPAKGSVFYVELPVG